MNMNMNTDMNDINSVEDVLGPAWEHNPDGRELKRQTDQLKSVPFSHHQNNTVMHGMIYT
jgi:hypothetical protein